MKLNKAKRTSAWLVLACGMSSVISSSVHAALQYSSWWPNSLHGELVFDKPQTDGNKFTAVAAEVENPGTSATGYLLCANPGKNKFAAPGIQIIQLSNVPGEIVWYNTVDNIKSGIKSGNQYAVNTVSSVLDDPEYYAALAAHCPSGHSPVRYISLAIMVYGVQGDGGLDAGACDIANYDYFYLDLSTPLTYYFDSATKQVFFEKRYYTPGNYQTAIPGGTFTVPSCPL